LAVQPLSRNFQSFFSRLNPGSSFEQRASSQHNTIRALIEDRTGLAGELEPVTFLQGSYRQQTAIYDINDVDIVVLCKLWYPGSELGGGKSYGRDEIFRIIAAPLLADMRYRDKVRYGQRSMCIKVDLGIQVEILPVVFKAGTSDPKQEPFALYRPETGRWEDGFARYHQSWLSNKNAPNRAQGNFIPMIKVLKHIRSLFKRRGVSFHIECLLYSLPDWVFWGEPATYITAVLTAIAATPAADWYQARCMTPCGDRDIFTASEWAPDDWSSFHDLISRCASVAIAATTTTIYTDAVEDWQTILGKDFFPATVL
jgi:SMODS domain-containing protein